MTLELMQPSDIPSSSTFARVGNIAGVYYLGYGRNAWHSKWVNKYYDDCISFDSHELKKLADRRRKQGSVFRIRSVPILSLLQDQRLYGIVPLNDGQEYQYNLLKHRIREARAEEFWGQFPLPQENWLLIFEIKTWDIIVSPYDRSGWRARSSGGRYRLSWTQTQYVRPPTLFSNFTRWLKAHCKNRSKP